MPRPDHVHALPGVPVPTREEVSEPTGRYWDKCVEKLGFVPNVVRAHSFDDAKLAGFTTLYNELMLGPSGLSRLEREMIAVAVSAANRCYYCLVAHGQAVRQLSGDPELGEMMVMNYRVAKLDARQRAMLDFAWKLTTAPHTVEAPDRAALRDVGLSEPDVFDLCDTIGFYNMSNRVAIGTDMMPNHEYHTRSR